MIKKKVNAPDKSAPKKPDTADHLKTVVIKDFKSLKNVNLELGQVNVFVGANGAGKSCLLEAVGILSASASGAVDDQALLRRGVRPGVPELYKSSFGNEKGAPKISLRATSLGGADYHTYISNPSKAPVPYWVFGNESVRFDGRIIASRGPKGNAKALGMSFPLENSRSITTLTRASTKTPGVVRDFLTCLDGFAIFSPVTPVLRAIMPDPAQRSPVGIYGGQLAEAIALLATTRLGKSALSEAISLIGWAEKISAGEPSRNIVSPSVPTSRTIVHFQDIFMAKGRQILSGYDASEGALYILFMMVLAVHSQAPKIFAVDNFDQALNPRTARELTRVFSGFALAEDRQVFLTTHNPLVLDGLNLGDDRIRLFTVGRDPEGHTKIRRVPVKNFEALKTKYGEHAVSRLWIEGRLGGMPDV